MIPLHRPLAGLTAACLCMAIASGQTIERVSVATGGGEANAPSGGIGDGNFQPYAATPASLSGDGRFVAFLSEATNLVPNDTNGAPDVFVRV